MQHAGDFTSSTEPFWGCVFWGTSASSWQAQGGATTSAHPADISTTEHPWAAGLLVSAAAEG